MRCDHIKEATKFFKPDGLVGRKILFVKWHQCPSGTGQCISVPTSSTLDVSAIWLGFPKYKVNRRIGAVIKFLSGSFQRTVHSTRTGTWDEPWGWNEEGWSFPRHMAGRRHAWCCCTGCRPCHHAQTWTWNLFDHTAISRRCTSADEFYRNILQWNPLFKPPPPPPPPI